MNRKQGFSVVEVLIALAIAAMAVVAIVMVFSQSTRSVSSTEDKLGILHKGRIMLEQIKRDLRQMYVDPANKTTQAVFEHNGIAFQRNLDGSFTSPTLEKITWSFEPTRMQVCRSTSSGELKYYGDKDVNIRFFQILQGGDDDGGRSTHFLTVRIDLSDPEDSPRNRLRLNGKIYPPMLQTMGRGQWVD